MYMYGHQVSILTDPLSELFEQNLMIIDREVQRKLSTRNARSIEDYLINNPHDGEFRPSFAPIVVSRRSNGMLAVLDGQHRCWGHKQALARLKSQIRALKNSNQQLSPEDQAALGEMEKQYDSLVRTVVPVMVFEGLSVPQERQIFHDLNHLGKKVSKSLALAYNQTDLYVRMAKAVTELPWMQPYIQQDKAMPYLKSDKLFLFSTLYAAMKQFVGPNLSEIDFDYWTVEVIKFFEVYLASLPEDYLSDQYLYRDGRVILALATFTRRMRYLEGVDWLKTLANALERVSFNRSNDMFVTIGGALTEQDGSVVLKGTDKGMGAVLRVLEAVAQRSDSEGNRVASAYSPASQNMLRQLDITGTVDPDYAHAEERIRQALSSSPVMAKMELRKAADTSPVLFNTVINRMIQNGDLVIERGPKAQVNYKLA